LFETCLGFGVWGLRALLLLRQRLGAWGGPMPIPQQGSASSQQAAGSSKQQTKTKGADKGGQLQLPSCKQGSP
jgi:hypothetical protein